MIPDCRYRHVSFSHPIGQWIEPIEGYGAYHGNDNDNNDNRNDWKIPIFNFVDSKWLIVFDLDSTLIDLESIDEMIRITNPNNHHKCLLITERAMKGEIDFQESLRSRVKLLEGFSASLTWQKCIENIKYKPGVLELVSYLYSLSRIKGKNYQFELAIISGGFMPIVTRVGKDLNIRHLYANNLEVENDKFTGSLSGRIIDGPAKRDIMLTLANDLSCNHTIAIGDGANDIPMIESSDYGIAIRGKKNVERASKLVIDNMATLCHLFT